MLAFEVEGNQKVCVCARVIVCMMSFISLARRMAGPDQISSGLAQRLSGLALKLLSAEYRAEVRMRWYVGGE